MCVAFLRRAADFFAELRISIKEYSIGKKYPSFAFAVSQATNEKLLELVPGVLAVANVVEVLRCVAAGAVEHDIAAGMFIDKLSHIVHLSYRFPRQFSGDVG